jgi:hypothetical protein
VHSTKGCEHYKDKSLFVELPCKVGDTVFCIWKYQDCFGTEDKPIVDEAQVNGWAIEKNGKVKIVPNSYAKMSDNWYTLIDICFTKEEAERKLKEMGV